MNTLLESWQAKMEAPFAVFGVRTIGERLVRIEYLPRGTAPLKPQTAFAREVCRQFKAYLTEPNFEFDLPFDYDGTDFQAKVWKAVRSIPAGAVLLICRSPGALGRRRVPSARLAERTASRFSFLVTAWSAAGTSEVS